MTKRHEVCEVVLTAPDEEWLIRFTDAVVADRLCAAVHRFPAINAAYWWHGELQRTTEYRASLHTRSSLADAVVSRIRREHPYEVPGVVVLPVVGGNPAYLEWIIAETATATMA